MERIYTMNYIFFDIECANCREGQAKICSFGYVVTDEEYNILEKKDLIINPRAPFMLMGHRNRPYIKLAYEPEEFKKAPDFSAVYACIKELMTRPDCLIFGYAADNDAGYLKCEFERYNLPSVDFAYYDLQKLLHFTLSPGNPNQISLSDGVGMLGGEVHQEIHKSDDDAYMTMQVLQGLERETGMPPVKLLEKYPVCRGDLKEGKVLVRILEGENLFVRILGDKSDKIAPKSENRILYTRFIRHVHPSGISRPQWLKGKRVCIPEKYAVRHYRDAIRFIQLVCDCGGRYSLIPEDCHVFVAYPLYNDDGSLKPCPELARFQKKHPSARPLVLHPAQFLQFCQLDEEHFAALPLPDIGYLLDERYAPQPREQGGKMPRRVPPVKKEREWVTIIPPEIKQ